MNDFVCLDTVGYTYLPVSLQWKKQTVLLWTDMFPFVAFSHVGLLKTSCTFWRSDFSLWGLVPPYRLSRFGPQTIVFDIAIFVLKRDVKLQLTNSAHRPHWGVPSNRPISFSIHEDIAMILMLPSMMTMKFAPSRYRVLLPMRPVCYLLLQTIMLVG